MKTDKAPADSRAFGYRGSGDAGRERVEHRSFMQLLKLLEMGFILIASKRYICKSSHMKEHDRVQTRDYNMPH